ncbi:unnamed protein product, partial [Plutella xylostella]
RGVAHGLVAQRGARGRQRAHAVGAVVLQPRQRRGQRVVAARAAQARQREVVVQREHALRVVERLHVLAGAREVARAPHVRQHVQVRGHTGLGPAALLLLQRVQVVQVGRVVGGARRLAGGGRGQRERAPQQRGPVRVLRRHDHLVHVQQRQPAVAALVPVQAVVVRDQLHLALVVGLLLEVDVLQRGQVGHAAGQRERREREQPARLVVRQHALHVGVRLQLVHVHGARAQQQHQLQPLHQPQRQVLVQEVEALHAHGEVLGRAGRGAALHAQQVAGRVARLAHQRHGGGPQVPHSGRQHARQQVGLPQPVAVVAPLAVPDVLVLEHAHDDGRRLLLEPDLAVRLERGAEAVVHGQQAHGGPDARRGAG